MQAPFELSEGKRRLEELINQFPSESPYWNEAQNRFQFIDRLLTECLGWEKPDIRVEEHDDFGGRSDYIFGTPPKAVLEAKKEAKEFENLPSAHLGRVRKIQPLLQASKNFSDAVRQVVPYCALHGASIAIVCNGPQLAVFQAIIPGQSPLEGECYFFNGFDSYVNDFPLLWKLLSPEGITENYAFRELSLHRNPRIPPKASTSIPEPNKYRYRTNFQENLRSLSSLLLEEIEDNPDIKSSFYKECYVPIEANNRNLLLSKNIIASRYNRAVDGNVAPSALETVAKTEKYGNLSINDPALTGSGTSRPIVVIGDVGVGKTSFFENLFESLEATEKSKTIFIHLNLGIKANLSDDIKSFVLSEIPAVLKDHYNIDIFSSDFANSVYYRDLSDFDKSVKGQLKEIDEKEYYRERINFLSKKLEDTDRHLQASLGHIARGQNKQVILVMDNADQRSLSVQQEAFLIAQELAASRNILVFIALRPSTFYLSKEAGALAAYQNKVLTVAPPPADEVVQRRLIFATRVAEGKVDPASLEGIRLNLGNVVLFLKATLRSIRNREDIRQFLSNITGGNTRSVIELISSFFGSPNVDSEKIVALEERFGNYKIPLHEFTKHALLGEYAYFNTHSSLLACNIFDVSAADPREHFLSSLIVAFLSSNTKITDSDGFCRGQDILTEMSYNGFIEDQIRNSLIVLSHKRLIETPHAHYREIEVPDHEYPEQFHFRVTSIGIYHIRYWSGSFAFLDAVSIDTPIFDEEARDKISKLSASFSIRSRHEKAVCFRKYLEERWHMCDFSANYYDFPSLISSQNYSFLSVERFIDQKKPG